MAPRPTVNFELPSITDSWRNTINRIALELRVASSRRVYSISIYRFRRKLNLNCDQQHLNKFGFDSFDTVLRTINQVLVF